MLGCIARLRADGPYTYHCHNEHPAALGKATEASFLWIRPLARLTSIMTYLEIAVPTWKLTRLSHYYLLLDYLCCCQGCQ